MGLVPQASARTCTLRKKACMLIVLSMRLFTSSGHLAIAYLTHTYIHAYIHTYIHTYIFINIYTYTRLLLHMRIQLVADTTPLLSLKPH